MMGAAEIFVGLLLAVAVLALVARRVSIPYPILFVLGGFLLSLISKLPKIRLDPDLVFLFVLPPLLYPAALFMPWRDSEPASVQSGFWPSAWSCLPRSRLHISRAITWTFRWLPASSWGAIISPPDAIAATAITDRLKVPRRIVTILQGESLLNDATALVAYRVAVAAVVTGTFSLAHASGKFFLVGLGGNAVGLAVGWLAEQFHKRVDDAPIEITVSLLTPFVAYLLAERLGLSGVLAVVTTGFYLGMRLPELLTFRTRLQSAPVWETLEFLLNGFVFILIGLQLPEVLGVLSGYSIPLQKLLWYALLISLAVILIRILWVFPATYLPRLLFKSIRRHDPYPSWRHVTIVAWTGMRGVVSLAAALAVPLSLENGAPFPGRELILFLTFVVIVATLVVQGLSLPLLIRWLGVQDDRSIEKEEREARLKANQAALQKLNEIAERDPTKGEALQRLRIEYEDHIRQLEGAEPQSAGTPLRLFSSEFERLSLEALRVERFSIIKLRDQDVISDVVLRRIQRDIDLAEARLEHHL